MHAKYRNGPGNGYRSNPMGMGGPRISPEGSTRGQRMYNPEYRNYNRGGYGRAKQFQTPLPPPRGADIFVEAGRLAAEYLVSKGVLPSNAFSGNWQSDGLKNQVVNFSGFRSHEVGNSALDVGSVRRRYSDEYSSIGSRGSMRIGSVIHNGSEVNKELGKSICDSDASIAGENGNGEIKNLVSGEITQEIDCEARVVLELEKSKLVDDENADTGSTKKSDDVDEVNDEVAVVKEGQNENNLEQKHCEDNKEVTALAGDNHIDLARHCKFVNVPTKARSNLTNKGSKGGHDNNPVDVNDKNHKKEPLEGAGVHVIDVDNDNSPCNNTSPLQNHEIKSQHSDSPAVEKEVDVTHKVTPGQCLRSHSFPERFGYEEQEHEGVSRISRSNSMFMETSGKRTLEFDGRDDFKKLKEWVPQSDSDTPPSSSIEQITSQNAHESLSANKGSLGISLFPKSHADSCVLMEEKQLFPGSSKSWDLNLVSENHDTTPIDVDLSISNNLPNKNGKDGVINNDIEIIDLDDDSAQEDKIFNNPDRRGANVFADLDGFPNNVHNANGIPDVQDGYGLMLSEFLGNDSVPTDLDSLHNHMSLPSEEEILGDDESIYMSLGEIPISLLGPWEQPPQNYGKPF